MSPGDKVTVSISVVNNSNIKIKYRVKIVVNGELKDALITNVDVPDWTMLDVGEQPSKILASVELPINAGNEYINKSASISFIVEGIQYNGLHTVEFYSEEGNILLYTDFVKDGEAAKFVGDIPEKKDHVFLGWDYDLFNITDDVKTKAMYQIIDDRLVFMLNEDKQSYAVAIDNCHYRSSYIEIPDSYQGLPVTKFTNMNCDNYGYYAEECVMSLILPDSITDISEGTLSYFENLRELRLPRDLNCLYMSDLERLTYLEDFKFPDNLKEVRFSDYNNPNIDYYLDSINYEYNTYHDGKYVGSENNPYFALLDLYVEDINQVNIHPDTEFIFCMSFECEMNFDILPQNVRYIGPFVYNGAENTNLEISIPSHIKYVGETAFHCFDKLSFEENSSIEVLPISALPRTGDSIIVPDSLKIVDISSGYFSDEADYTVREYNEYKGAKYIGSTNNPYHILLDAREVIDINNFEIHPDTKIIWSRAFRFTSFEEISLPDGLISITGDAFVCSNIRKITIPSSVEYIGDSAFSFCSNLEYINFVDDGTNKDLTISKYAFDNCSSLDNLLLPKRVTSIDDFAFSNCASLSNLDIEEGAKYRKLGRGIFMDCTSLTSVTIPSSFAFIPKQMFENCTLLEEVTYAEPCDIHYIGVAAFKDCTSLKEIYIPNSIVEIQMESFRNCSSVNKITFEENSCLTKIDDYGLEINTYIDEFIMPNSVVYMGESALIGVRTKLVLSDNLEYLGSDNFVGFGDSLAHLGTIYEHALYFPSHSNPYYLLFELYYEYNESTGEYEYDGDYIIHEETRIIFTGVFSSAETETIVIPDNVVYIGYAAFNGSSVKEIILPSNLKYLGADCFGQSDIENVDFSKVNRLKYIPHGAFNNCNSLTSIELPDQIVSIHEYSIGSENLTSIKLPENLETISSEAIYAGKLTSIELLDNVNFVREDAFGYDTSLEELIINSNVYFGRINANKVIINEGKVVIYNGTFTNYDMTNNTPVNSDDLIVINNGELVIYGGYFASEISQNTIVTNANSNVDITIYGGTFVNFDPSEYVPEGYVVETFMDEYGNTLYNVGIYQDNG